MQIAKRSTYIVKLVAKLANIQPAHITAVPIPIGTKGGNLFNSKGPSPSVQVWITTIEGKIMIIEFMERSGFHFQR